jgi:hypothetical protein
VLVWADLVGYCFVFIYYYYYYFFFFFFGFIFLGGHFCVNLSRIFALYCSFLLISVSFLLILSHFYPYFALFLDIFGYFTLFYPILSYFALFCPIFALFWPYFESFSPRAPLYRRWQASSLWQRWLRRRMTATCSRGTGSAGN